MKSTRYLTAALLLLTFGLFLLVFGIVANAQDTNTVAPPDAPAVVGTGLEATIIQLAQTHPWIIGVLAVIGSLRFVIKPLLTAVRFVTSQTASTRDDEVVDRVERSWLFTLVLFGLDWLASIKVRPDARPAPAATNAARVLALCAALSLVGTGCGTLDPAGVYQGDQVLHSSELAITTSYEVIHTYVSWEKENRPALAAFPEIKSSADVMRSGAKQWFATANALHDAYAANPTPEHRDALTTALAVLRTAMNEAVKYMAQASAPPPQ